MKAFKVFIISLLVVVVVWILLCVFHLAFKRTIDAEIIAITNSTITFKDSTGNLWEVENDSYMVGDKVILTIEDKGTDFLTDDEIVKIEKKDLTK